MTARKKKRPMGRLPQLSKRLRLVRRSLGQWVAPAPEVTWVDEPRRNLDYTGWVP